MSEQVAIDRQALSGLLPHDGRMCLLDAVLNWDDDTIQCLASSHREGDNPLRYDGRLSIQAGIEYAAQAMAVHGSLCDRRAGRPQIGYLAVLSKVDWYGSRLDDLPGDLCINAHRLMATATGFSYQFSVKHEQKLLLEGLAVVALQEPR